MCVYVWVYTIYSCKLEIRPERCSYNSGRIHKASEWGHKLHLVFILYLMESSIDSVYRTWQQLFLIKTNFCGLIPLQNIVLQSDSFTGFSMLLLTSDLVDFLWLAVEMGLIWFCLICSSKQRKKDNFFYLRESFYKENRHCCVCSWWELT